jgi:membrane-associated phospholipid phosphatase
MTTYTNHLHAARKQEQELEEKKALNTGNIGLWISFAVGLIIFVLCAIPAHSHELTGVQATIFHAVNNLNLPAAFTTVARWMTEALGAAWPIAACVLVSLLLKKFRLAWRFFFTAGGTVAVFYVVKKIINEPRPIVMLHGNLHQRVVETGPGFPSGHEAAATALALTLWFALPAKWRWVSILWILLVAWSRLYLGVHAPVDVIGGFALGLMAVCFVRLLPNVIAKPMRLDEDA